jgi:predicted DNA-binding protein
MGKVVVMLPDDTEKRLREHAKRIGKQRGGISLIIDRALIRYLSEVEERIYLKEKVSK